MENIDRRRFLACSGAAATLASLGAVSAAGRPSAAGLASERPQEGRRGPGDDHRGACVISSGNGLPAVARAMELMAGGTYPLDAVVEGVRIVEDDPNDNSVGLGGLPNEEGIVELDASVMDGPSHRAGSVGALRNIKNPAAVALHVMRRTDHVMLVGEGALRFARAMGFREEDLLTDASREAWLRWKGNLSKDDWWLGEDQQLHPPGPAGEVPGTTGTIHCSAVSAGGDVASCTTTSGLSWKLPGRLGDSPIVGAGMYCDNDVGAAGATGRGESVIQVCGAFAIVRHIESGLTPTQACLAVARAIVDKTKIKRLLDERGRPRFNVSLYAVRKDGAFGAAAIWRGAAFTVHDGREARRLECAWLYERDRR